jgi:protein gp37
MDLDWARRIRDDCMEHGIPLFFKQVGGTKKIDGIAGGDLLDGQRHYMWPGDEWTYSVTLPAGELGTSGQLRLF